MQVSEIVKERPLRTIAPGKTVQQAILTLCEYNIGALPVCESDGEVLGIITERDVLRLCAGNDCQQALQQRVSEVMTRNLIICVPHDSIENAMHVMTQKRIRHLPILEGRKLVGMLSIGDVVKAKLDDASAEIRFMRDYLAGA